MLVTSSFSFSECFQPFQNEIRNFWVSFYLLSTNALNSERSKISLFMLVELSTAQFIFAVNRDKIRLHMFWSQILYLYSKIFSL